MLFAEKKVFEWKESECPLVHPKWILEKSQYE